MAVCKCKMCGGDLTITELDKIVTCEYCGTTQTVPSADNEKKMTLFNRANKLRFNSEFDKAAGIYENIVAEYPDEAEAYWGVLLCKYGVEYVTDPATGKKIPTCHRSSFDSVMEDDAFEQACENADALARRVYREEAKRIEEIRRGIIEVSSKEAPYDIFICYKETDEAGGRTEDSVLAQDVYTLLVEKGYRVFFSRVSLADKVGKEYEPYIFAALNSAKIMLVFGTDYEYFNAVWVKNEWSRYLRLIAAGQKKTLIPCFKDIDAYDLPKEFVKLQSVDLGSVSALPRLLQSIEKLIPKAAPAQTAAPVIVNPAAPVIVNPAAPATENLLRRAFLFLEDGDWTNADAYAEKVLDLDFENAEAYLVKAMADLQVRNRAALGDVPALEQDPNTAKALRFGSDALQTELNGYITASRVAAEEAEKARREAEEKRLREEREEALRLEEARKEKERKERERKEEERKRRMLLAGCISAGIDKTVAVGLDGTLLTTEGESPEWNSLQAVSAGPYHTLGLRTNGTVVAAESFADGRCNVESFRDITAISAGHYHTVVLRKDGTVFAVGNNDDSQCNVSDWRDIAAVSAGNYHTVGLRSDGTVLAVGNNNRGQCEVRNWDHIVMIAAGGFHTVGLRDDGTVVAKGFDNRFQCRVAEWTDIVFIAAGPYCTVGVKADGTVLAVGRNVEGQCDVSAWKNIAIVSCGYYHTVGVRRDGTVISTGDNSEWQCEVSDWRLFNNIDTFLEDRAAATTERNRALLASLPQERAALVAELPTLKGIFKAGRRKEVEARLAEIDAALKTLS